ncbi:carbon starvation CstA family protein [Microtetraspora sp. NBRC 16547]|uniref:carbon starvation CstA family protein n=1 Tax=Microtetraspora sp. NBRC 16547 TaxID=3030993 RepID=UPI0024A08B96|nr:carbon starvation CstA family protein [Microtetraspora sp. NBRC 16547]GLW96636.1 putative carbon starvation protein [Microtetraspora sp. NBRC 16547]
MGTVELQPPPVEAEHKTRWTPPRVAVWVAIALLGGIAWSVLALGRGEHVNAVWFIFAALSSYAIAYRFYARFIVTKVLRADDKRATPAERMENGLDFTRTDRRVVYGHHFAAIAGAGPLVGPVLAAQMGYLPGTIWIIVGVIFAGAVQDLVVLFFSMRRNGRSLGQMARDEIGPLGGVAALIAVLAIMVIILAVLALVVVNSLAASPWGVFSIAMTIPIALFMGFYLRYLRPGRVSEVSLIGCALLILAIVAGGWVADSALADVFTLDKVTLVWCLIIYGFLASVLPVWMLLAPRDYLSTFMKVGTIALLALGILIAMPATTMPAFTDFAFNGKGPAFAGSMFPFVFITIACGALSGFHALISSGTTPKMVEKERQVKLIGYGGMLTESFVAIMALVAACTIDQGLYFAMNSAAGMTGGTAEGAATFVNGLGLAGVSTTPDALNQAAAAVQEQTLVSRTGGAPTLAIGISEILGAIFGGATAKAFWYHFAIMFEALFILTTVDAGTRVGRFMLQDTLGNVIPKFKDTSWKAGSIIASAVIVAGWGSILLMGVSDPLGGINTLFPLFGIANQLLAAVALAVCVTILCKTGRVRYAWVPGIPLVWDAVVTLTASWQKIFSSEPSIGYWAQHQTYKAAIAAGKTSLGAAKDPDQMEQVVRNTFVQGTLSVIFAVLIIIVLVDAIRRSVSAIRSGRVNDTEHPAEPSRVFAPSGLFATAEEKELQQRWRDYEAARSELAGTGSSPASAGS